MNLHLLEPTLYDQTGHGYSYTQALINANKSFNFSVHLWCDRRGKKLEFDSPCTIHPYFFRQARQLQKIFLYRKLIKQPGIIFINTSELWDLQILANFLKHHKATAKIFAHFHQFKQSPKKIACLRQIAAQQNALNIVCTTQKLANIFIANGFKNCKVVACPGYKPLEHNTAHTNEFHKVIYAGAAREDKGFPQVVDLIEYCQNKNIQTRFAIQISPPNSSRYDHASKQALQRLLEMPKDNLFLINKTLDKNEYQSLFKNSISLLLYRQKDYEDKFSGVALDAFYAGSPIITAKNTWMGDMVEKYHAGITLSDYNPETIEHALQEIIGNYARYHANAKDAAAELIQVHDPKHTLALLTDPKPN